MSMGIRRAVCVIAMALLLNGCFDDDKKPPVGGGTSGIGSAGGTVEGPNGAKIVVPPGALSGTVRLEIAQTSSGAPPFPSNLTPLGAIYAFTPHGTTFATPVTVSVPFNASQVPAGATPHLYKTNATQTDWELVVGATANGDIMSGQVTSFSHLIVTTPPPAAQFEGIHREWYVEKYLSHRSEALGDVGHDDEGEVEDSRELGVRRFANGELIPATGWIYSSPTGKTFAASVFSPATKPKDPTVAIGGRTQYDQVQWFRKTADSATLRMRITNVTLQAFDGDPRPLLGDIAGVAYAEMSVTGFHESGPATPFFKSTGIVRLAGKLGHWYYDAWSQTPRALWKRDSFDFDPDVSGVGTWAHLSLRRSIVVNVPLDDIALNEKFTITTRVTTDAIDFRQTESYASAYLKDPQEIGGESVIEFDGLEVLPPEAHGIRVAPPEVAPACTGTSSDEAGRLTFTTTAYEYTEGPQRGMHVLVERVGGMQGVVGALVTTSDGTAIAGTDYTSVSQHVTFDDGEDGLRGVFIPMPVDAIEEADKMLHVTLSDARGCAALGDTTSATITIVDDDRQTSAPPTFTVGGSVTGLVGTGFEIEDVRTGARLTPSNGAFTFGYAYPNLSTYEVRVTSQPTNPIQHCTVSNGSGAIGDANVSNVEIDCVTLAPTGSLDTSFGESGKVTSIDLPGGARAVALQADGKILVVGRMRVMRFNADGSRDAGFGNNGLASVAFNSGLNDEALTIAVQPDQKILVAGYTRVGTQDDFGIARFNANGSPDTTFGTQGRASVPILDNGTTSTGATIIGGTDRAYKILVQPDGKILVAGHGAYSVNDHGLVTNQNSYAVVRLEANGALDPTFSGDGRATHSLGGADTALAYAAVLQADGKILVGGRYGTATGEQNVGLVRFDTDGSIEPTFGRHDLGYTDEDIDGDWDEISDLVVTPDGSILAAAQVLASDGFLFRYSLLRFDSDGAYDRPVITPIGANHDYARAIALQSDGKILLAGQASSGTVSDFAIVRHNENGTLDGSFGTNGVLTVDFFSALDGANDMLVQPDGKILVVGVTRSGSSNILGMVRIAP